MCFGFHSSPVFLGSLAKALWRLWDERDVLELDNGIIIVYDDTRDFARIAELSLTIYITHFTRLEKPRGLQLNNELQNDVIHTTSENHNIGKTMVKVVPLPGRELTETVPFRGRNWSLTTSNPTPRPDNSLTSEAVENPGSKIKFWRFSFPNVAT